MAEKLLTAFSMNRTIVYMALEASLCCLLSEPLPAADLKVVIGSDEPQTQVTIEDGGDLDENPGLGVIRFERVVPGKPQGTPRNWMASGTLKKTDTSGGTLGTSQPRAVRLTLTDVKIGPSGVDENVALGDISVSLDVNPPVRAQRGGQILVRADLAGTYVKMGAQLHPIPDGELDVIFANWITPPQFSDVGAECRGVNCPGAGRERPADAPIQFDGKDVEEVAPVPVVSNLFATLRFFMGPAPLTSTTGDGLILEDSAFIEAVEDCNRNGIGDRQELASGSATDRNSNGILDVCEISTVACSFRGVAEGGEVGLTVHGFDGTCSTLVGTTAGQTAQEVMGVMASAVNGDTCFVGQAISATASDGTLRITGFDLGLSDIVVSLEDPGIEPIETVLKVPTLSPQALAILVLLVAGLGALLTRRGL